MGRRSSRELIGRGPWVLAIETGQTGASRHAGAATVTSQRDGRVGGQRRRTVVGSEGSRAGESTRNARE